MKRTMLRAVVGLALLLLVILSSKAAAPPTVAGPVVRWSSLDGDDQLFEAGRVTALGTAPDVGRGPFSVSVWVAANDLAGGNAFYGRGIVRSSRGEQVGDWLLAVHPDGRVRFCNWRAPGDDKTGSHVTRAALVKVGTWHHLAATFDGKASRVYVNGVEAATAAGQTAAGWGVGHEVGRSWTQPDYYWDGRIDDLRVYKRALEQEQIRRMAKTPPPQKTLAALGPSGDAKVSAAVDKHILDRLREKKVRPAPAADDSAFHRRVLLDLAGRIPTPAETDAFVADKAADKRARLIESILAGPEMPVYWSQVLSGWLMPAADRRDPNFVSYLRTGLARNKSWDTFAREMLTASSGPAVGFLGARRPALYDRSIARDLGEVFFGVNLRCAQCHDHPTVKDWTRERFYGLSAFFVRTTEPVPNRLPLPGQPAAGFIDRPSGELEYVAQNGKKKVAPPLFLDGKALIEPQDKAAPFSRREGLARMALDAKSPYFKRAMANRVWRKLMGRGLFEPVDMMHDDNPATHPALLDLLADDFAEHRFDLRRLIAVIMHSEAYARSSRWSGEDPPDEKLYATAVLKPLDADQLAVSLPLAAGHLGDAPKGKRDSGTARSRAAASWREILTEFDAPGDGFEPTAVQALFLLNSEQIQTRLLANSPLVKALSGLSDDEALARRAYLSILSRPPTKDEVARVGKYLSRRGPKARAEACRELAWALLSGSEFRFNH